MTEPVSRAVPGGSPLKRSRAKATYGVRGDVDWPVAFKAC